MGLLDIGPITEDVLVGKNKRLSVGGLSAEDIFYLINNFTEVRALVEKKLTKLSPKQLMDSAPKTIATIIACGTGERDDKKAVLAAQRLGAAVQLKLINKIFELTFPDGVGPFVEELWLLQRAFTARVESSSTQSDSSNPSVSGKPSQSALSAALQMDEVSKQRYRPRRVNSPRGLN